jgi:hypothetical protein
MQGRENIEVVEHYKYKPHTYACMHACTYACMHACIHACMYRDLE